MTSKVYLVTALSGSIGGLGCLNRVIGDSRRLTRSKDPPSRVEGLELALRGFGFEVDGLERLNFGVYSLFDV